MGLNKILRESRGGRSIGGGRDQSAPTAASPPGWETLGKLFKSIIGPYAAAPRVWETPLNFSKSTIGPGSYPRICRMHHEGRRLFVPGSASSIKREAPPGLYPVPLTSHQPIAPL